MSRTQQTTNAHKADKPATISTRSHDVLSRNSTKEMLQRSIGNQSLIQDWNKLSDIQAKLKTGQPNDTYEQEADQVAEQVTGIPDSVLSSLGEESLLDNDSFAQNNKTQFQDSFAGQDKAIIQAKTAVGVTPKVNSSISSEISSLEGSGQSLSGTERGFFEPRFGMDLSAVRIHTDFQAANIARSVNARAFTSGRNVVFGAGEYTPGVTSGRKLLAHELMHVIQQNREDVSGIQRAIELRPPGRGEATAFDRANELVDRLNNLSLAIDYALAEDGRTLTYTNLLPERVTNFDQQMMDFIDLNQIIPMRLITSAGSVNHFPIVGDSFLRGYVDLDDLMASDDLGFQSILVHFMEERAVTRRYDERIGTPSLDPGTPDGNRAFTRAHRAGHTAQAEHFRDVFNDPSIIFNRERRRNNAGDADIIFRSTTHNYRILLTLRRAVTSSTGTRPRSLTGGNVSVRYQNHTYTVDDFLNNGPLAATLRPVTTSLGLLNLRRPQLGFNIPGLSLEPGLRIGRQIPERLGQFPSLNHSLTPDFSSSLQTEPNLLGNLSTLSFPTLSPDPNLIDWLSIRGELNSRGAPFDSQMQSSVTSLWINNYSFLNQVIGLSPDRATFWTNRTIPMAVGAGVNRDFPSMIEQMDRELDTSSLIVPVSDILMFLINR